MLEYDDPQHDEPAPVLRRTRRRVKPNRLARLALGAAGLVVTAALVASGIGFAWLGSGPISLESLQPSIAASLQSRLKPGYTVALGPTSLTRGDHGLAIGFSGLAIRDPQGRVVVGAPGGKIGLDALALLRMDVKVRRLELDKLHLSLHVGSDGALSLAAAGDNAAAIPLGASPAGAGGADLGALVAGIAAALTSPDQPLDHVAIVEGQLSVQNEPRAEHAVYDDFRLTFDRSGDSAVVALSAEAPAGRWGVEARAEAGATRKLTVAARDLAAEDFSRLDPKPPPIDFDPPISFDFSAETTPSGKLSALDGVFSLGAGTIDPHDPDSPPLAIDEATGKLSLDKDGIFRIGKLEVLAGPTHFRFGGRLVPPGAGDAFWRLQLHSDDVLIAGAKPQDRPARLDKVDLDARADAVAGLFVIDKLVLHGPHLDGQLTAQAQRVGDGAAVRLDVSGSGAILEALRLWPTFLNPDARKWCLDNIKAGELSAGSSIKVDLDPAAIEAIMAKKALRPEAVDGRFALRDAAVDLLPGLPTTTGLEAFGEITGRTFHAGASRGVMELGGSRKLYGTDLSFTVPDTAPAPRMSAFGSGHIVASADSLAELLTREALKKYVGVALEPATVKGQATGDLKLDLTLGKGVQPEEQKFRATGSLSALSIDKFLGNTKLEQGSLEFVSDRTQIKMTGNGQVLGAPARLDLLKVGQDIGSLTVTGVLDDATRAKLGFNAGPRVKGPVTMKLKAPLDKAGADVEVDLTKASVDALAGPVSKSAGRAGKATFQLRAAPDGVQVNNLAVDAGTLSGRGSAFFGPEGDIKWVKLAPFRMNASDDLKLDFAGGAAPKLTVRGANLDARGFVKALTDPAGGEGDGRSLDVDVKVSAASGYNREQISGLELTAARRGGAFGAIEARGKLGQGAFSARGVEGGLVNIKADDAGALARFLDLYSKLEGGAIEMSLRTSAEGTRGTATIKRFSIRDEPSLRQLEQAAPPPSSTVRGNSASLGADSPPVRFDKATANFTRIGGKLDVRDGVVASPAFGLTAQGFLDFGKDKVDLSGVYVPLYQFNNALGAIPVLGLLLTGGQNEGVFAINYRVTGPASKPTLNVNPLSGMTPGILRKMFGAIDGTAPPLSPDSPASSYAPTLPQR